MFENKKKIYILPNIFTTMNMFCGFFAIISSLNGKFYTAAIAILIAMIFDILDGKVARYTNTMSNFGLQYDSLSDLISFGLAPGLTTYLWALKPFNKIGWIAAFLFTICGALRLARFNSQSSSPTSSSPSNYFTGLPIPAAAGCIASSILIFDKFDISLVQFSWVILFELYGLAFLMVSTIKYNSFKKFSIVKEQTRFDYLIAFILLFVFIVIEPAISLSLIAILYVSSGFLNLFILSKNKKEIKEDA